MKNKTISPWRSIGVKLPVTLALVVIITALGVSLTNDWLVQNSLEGLVRSRLDSSLETVMYIIDHSSGRKQSPADSLGDVAPRLANPSDIQNRIVAYGLDNDGRVVVPPVLSGFPMPPDHVMRHIASLGRGMFEVDIAGQKGWVAFSRDRTGQLVVVLQVIAADAIEPTLHTLHEATGLAAIVLVVFMGMAAIALATHELSSPIKQLTLEAERVSRGDLTPPVPFNRQDELGRLSLALAAMTKSAAGMVREARASQARFEGLFTDSRDAAFVINNENRMVEANPAAVEIFGYDDRDDLLSLAGTKQLFVDPEQRAAYLAEMEHQGYVQDHHLLMRRKNGEQFEALVTASALGEGGGRFGLVRDVTPMLNAQRALKESEERLRRLVENVPDIIYRWSIDDETFEFISPALTYITGLLPKSIQQDPRDFFRCLTPDSREKVFENWADLMSGEGPPILEQEFEIIDRQGKSHWLLEHSVLVTDSEGNPKTIEGVATDVTAGKEVERARRMVQRSIEATLAGLPAAVMVIDRDHRVLHWNRAMEQLTGVRAEEMIGTRRQYEPFYTEPRPVLADMLLDSDDGSLAKLYHKKGIKKSSFIEGGVEAEDYFPSLGGKARQLYFLAAPITDEQGKIIQAVETLVDLSDKRQLEEELTRLSITDELTGLYNRRFFYASLYREASSALRHHQPLSLALTDIDKFKNFNDLYGHLEGDTVLAQSAAAVRRCLRLTDIACRYGGEEFVVLLPHTDHSEAVLVGERIRKAVADLRFSPKINGRPNPGDRVPIAVSVGVATLDQDQTPEDLVRLADEAMYHAKRAGGNQVAALATDGAVTLFPTIPTDTSSPKS